MVLFVKGATGATGLFDSICANRLRAAIDVELPRLYHANGLSASATSYEKLPKVTPAVGDRLGARYRAPHGRRRG